MAYFHDNGDFHSPSYIPEELDSHAFLQCYTLATTEDADQQTTPTFTGCWTTVYQSRSTALQSTNLPATMDYESVSPTLCSYPALSCGSYRPTINQSTQLDHPETLSRDILFANEQLWDTAVPSLTPNPAPTESWTSQQYGVPTNAAYVDNTLNHHRPRQGAIRAGMMDSRRFTPYGTHRTHSNVHENTETGPPAQILPLIPYAAPQTTQPAGGISETMVDAGQKRTITEEEESTVPQIPHTHGEGLGRPHRRRNQSDVRKLRTWAKTLEGLPGLPSHKHAINAATEIISVIRQPVYDEDRLVKGHGCRARAGSRRANKEYERRNGTRQVYQKLSRYYHLEQGRTEWRTTQLLLRVLEDLDNLDEILRRV